ncbi:MAG TPA: 3-hydroxyacyl-CoA dehydrogenase/enoyl-CoA hydratase family protein [Planctomycetes bacterium]|nr:3-hydroxyacyl-CoA dehydrogenase/enoyl-CoA hydratase family protein [Planctomycetota bacterium]HIN81044.1 3-hydroxyacyl-CoA dehydrogenase/enoyl-CoA hydratase family protein [Planctomycetota bacterium]
MTLQILDRPITKIGVIGSGQIGPDIALHFSKVFTPQGVPVIVVDVSREALENGRKKLDRKVDKGVESGAFTVDAGEAMKGNVTFTDDYQQLAGTDLVVEAATEDSNLKGKIFNQLTAIVSDGAILCSNSSHLEPEVIFGGLEDPSRSLVVHYFFPAERNPVVEVVSGAGSDPGLGRAVMGFYEEIGKFPIEVGSRYGYAIDPIFEGLFLASALLVEEGKGTSKEVDAVACKTLGYTVGPFTAMNLTGGNPITDVGLGNYTSRIMPWYRSPQILKDAVKNQSRWEVPARGEGVEVEPERSALISESLLGAYFGIVGEIVDSGISSVADLDMAVEIALDMHAPFRLMNRIGLEKSLGLVENYAAKNPGFSVPLCLVEQAGLGEPFPIATVFRWDREEVAIVCIRRPRALNALNEATFEEIKQHFLDIAADDSVIGAVLTGYGVKAFASGADVGFLAKIDSKEMGEKTSSGSQLSIQAIEDCPKPVVCAFNGLALGGGNEIALACNARIAREGLKVLAGQPEVNLGIIPGGGGTQRLPRWVGIEKASELMRTGRPVSSSEALRIGLIEREVPGSKEQLLSTGIDMVRAAVAGETPLPEIQKGPIQVPEMLPEVDLGHLSRMVDGILSRAILEGCRLPLKEGIAFEARMFGEVCATRDMNIGIQNFLEKGPRHPAPFIHS